MPPNGSRKLYNAKILRNYAQYLRLQLRWDAEQVSRLFRACGRDASLLANDDNWFDQEFSDRFHDQVSKLTRDPAIARKVGRYTATSYCQGIVGRFAKSLLTPEAFFRKIPEIVMFYTRATRFSLTSLGRSRAVLRSTVEEECVERPYQCENRKGILEAVPSAFGCRGISLKETECYHRGGRWCEYEITWNSPWRVRPFAYSTILAIVTSFLIFGFGGRAAVSFAQGLFVGGLVFLCLREWDRYRKEKISREQNEALEQSLETLERHKRESELVRSVTRATTQLAPEDDLLRKTAASLRREEGYDRVLILMMNPTTSTLSAKAWAGFDVAHENLIREMEFNVRPDNYDGFFVQVINSRKPLLVCDLQSNMKTQSRKTQQYIRLLGTEAFAAVPIQLNNRAVGLLSVENKLGSRPLFESDLELLGNLADHLAVSIANSRHYEEARSALGLAKNLETREREMKRRFSKYVPTHAHVPLSPLDSSAMLVQKKELSVMFVDIISFTTMSEQYGPEDVVRMLNIYIDEVAQAVALEEGQINKIMGDGLLLYFEGVNERAIRAGRRILQTLPRMNERLMREGFAPVHVGIGAHRGECTIGNIGSRDRIDYTLIGDTVNIASRIQAFTRNFGPDTFCLSSALKYDTQEFGFEFQGDIELKGRKGRIGVFRLTEGENA